MVTYIYSADWFHGIESIFDIIYIVVGLLIAYFGYKSYKYIPKKSSLYFALSFFLIAASFFIKMLSDATIYSRVLVEKSVGLNVVKTYVAQRIDWISNMQFYGPIIARFLMLLAFLILLVVTLKIKDKKLTSLLVYFIMIASLLSEYSYIVFHVTSALILFILSAHYWDNFKKQKKANSNFVAVAFFTIFLSQLVFAFANLNQNILYVVGAVLQLIGYLILLYTIILVLKK